MPLMNRMRAMLRPGVVPPPPGDDPQVTPQEASGAAATYQPTNIRLIKGEAYALPDAEDGRKWAFLAELMRSTEQDALALYKQGTRNLLYLNGRQWIDWVISRRTFEDLPNGTNELRATMNYIRPIVRARASRIIPDQIGWTVTPTSNSYEARDRAQVAMALVKARFKLLEAVDKARSAQQLAYCCGYAAIKSFWNPNIGTPRPATIKVAVPKGINQITGQPIVDYEDVPIDQNGQPVQDISQAYHYRPGDTDMAVRTMFNIRLNLEAHGWTAAEGLRWLLDSEVVPLTVAREKFPDLADRIAPMDSQESYLTYERIAQGGQVAKARGAQTVAAPNAGSQTASELTVIREYWELPSGCFQNGRLLVMVGGITAYDGDFPQGIFPYVPIFDELGHLSAKGRPCVNDMISPQDVVNREWTAITREMAGSAAGQYVSWNVPGVPDQLNSSDRTVIRLPLNSYLAGRSIKDVFHRLEGAQVPGDRWRMIEQAKLALFDIGAYHEISRGQIPPGLDSGVAIEKLQEAEEGQLKEPIAALRRSLVALGRHQLAIAKWGYGEEEERAIPMDRPDLKFMVETVKGDELPDPDSIILDIEPFQPQSQAALRAEIKEVVGLGLLDPRSAVKAMDLGRGVESIYESQGRDYARARRENLAMETGQIIGLPQGMAMGPNGPQPLPPAILNAADLTPVLLPEDDDHQVHIDVHYEVLKDDTVPYDVRQLVLAHVQEHRGVLQQRAAMAQMAAAASAPPSEGGKGGDGGGGGE